MSILQEILNARGGATVQQLARQFGVDATQANAVLQSVVPALAGGVKRNVAQSDGLDALMRALAAGNHTQYLDDPSRVGDAATVDDGNAILGHLFGSKDVSRAVATRTAASSGISGDLVKKMLPVIATLVMGSLSKQRAGGTPDQLTGGSQGRGIGDLFTSFLDADGDGSMVDDVLGMFLKR